MKRVMLILLYLIVVCGPVSAACGIIDTSLLTNISMGKAADLAALLAIAILSLQFVLSARIRRIEKPFGLDKIMLFHRFMAISAAILLVSHPLLLAADPNGDDGWKLLYSVGFADEGWKIMIGKAALLVLLTTAVISHFRLSLKIEYQLWLRLHDFFALSILTAAFIHSLLMGPHVHGNTLMQTLWLMYPAIALSAICYNRIIRASNLKAHSYRVAGIRQETDSVWTVTMTAPGNSPVYCYQPGQFHFITFFRSNDVRHEEHPFTISSSPAGRDFIRSSIKASGDYTSTIGETIVGDRAALLGPFGRFSYLLHPSESNIVCIAGGIGITPFMSMLRYMRDSRDQRNVILLYGNRKEKDIAFRKELDEISAKGVPRLRIIHVLGQADDTWEGIRGRISIELIKKECASLADRVFYLCGPPMMMIGLVKNLKKAGVKKGNIRYERFSI